MQIIFKGSKIDYSKIKRYIDLGSVIIYPTDTVYGVGGKIESENTLKKIYKAKSREYTSPLIGLISSKDIVLKYATVPRYNAKKYKLLVEKFWPGALTIILKKRSLVPGIMVSNGKTIGIRMPNHEVALKIIEAAGGILPTTSANISGETSPRSFDELSEEFISKVDIVIDGGISKKGIESTIIDLTEEKIKILRVGAISKEEIESIIGKI